MLNFKIMIPLCALVIISTNQPAHTDEPLTPPKAYQDCIDASLGSPDVTTCVSATPNEPTIISITRGKENETSTWQIPHYYRHSFLSLDGRTLITTNSDGLITLTEPPLETILLSLWKAPPENTQNKAGSLVRHITVGDLYEDIDGLKRTASHHHWGKINRSFTYDDAGKLQLLDSLLITSADNRTLIIDIKSGLIEDLGDFSIDASNKGG